MLAGETGGPGEEPTVTGGLLGGDPAEDAQGGLEAQLDEMKSILRTNFDQVAVHNAAMARQLQEQQAELHQLKAYKERASAHLQAQHLTIAKVSWNKKTWPRHYAMCWSLLTVI